MVLTFSFSRLPTLFSFSSFPHWNRSDVCWQNRNAISHTVAIPQKQCPASGSEIGWLQDPLAGKMANCPPMQGLQCRHL